MRQGISCLPALPGSCGPRAKVYDCLPSACLHRAASSRLDGRAMHTRALSNPLTAPSPAHRLL